MWAASIDPHGELTRVKFPRINDKLVQKEPVYASPTTYYLITLPSQS